MQFNKNIEFKHKPTRWDMIKEVIRKNKDFFEIYGDIHFSSFIFYYLFKIKCIILLIFVQKLKYGYEDNIIDDCCPILSYNKYVSMWSDGNITWNEIAVNYHFFKDWKLYWYSNGN